MVKKVCILMAAVLMVSAANATLISHFEFEQNWDNSVAGGLDGITTGGPGSTFANDLDRGWVADLNVAGSYIYQGYDTTLNTVATNNQFSVAVWMNSTAGTNWQQIYGRKTEWGIRMADGKVQLFTGFGTLGGVTEINDGQWHHIAATFNGSTGEAVVYVDGVEDAATTLTGTLTSSLRAAIGARSNTYSGADFVYTGYLDDLRAYDTALSSTEVAALVPEPATLGLLAFGAFGLIRRRK